MPRLVQCILWSLLLSLSSCTDLAAVYKNDILILRDADSILPDSPLSWESLSLALPRPLTYPVGLTQDSLNNRLFVAEAKPKEEGKILSLTLNTDYKVVDMAPAVKSSLVSVIEGMSYSPKSGHLYWTDATVQHIYKAMIPKERGDTVSRPEVIRDIGSRNKPRGLAVDPCNELLYWSEKGRGGVPSRVEMWNPDDNKHHIIQDEGKSNFYQGLTFDATSRNLLWAVTKGDEINSTCRIVKTSVDDMLHTELVNMENCYPFSLTSDEKYIYWADWGRQGIMRASLTDPTNVIKLVHTPHTTSTREDFGVYGLTRLVQENPADDDICKGKDEKTQNYEDKMLQDPTKNSHTETGKKGSGEVTVPDASSSDPEPDKTQVNDGKDAELMENAGSSGHSEDKEDIIPHKDRIVLDLKHTLLEAESSSEELVEEDKSVDVTEAYNGKTQTDLFALNSTYDLPTTEKCHESQLVIAVLVLSAISALFLGTTVALAFMLYRRRTVFYKAASPAIMEAPQALLHHH